MRLLESYGPERMPVGDNQCRLTPIVPIMKRRFCAADSAISYESPAGEASASPVCRGISLRAPRARSDPTSENIKLGYCYDKSPIIWSDGTAGPAEDVWDFVPSARPGSRAPACMDRRKSIYAGFISRHGFVLLRFGKEPPPVLVSCSSRNGSRCTTSSCGHRESEY